MKDEALKLALEALEGVVKNCWRDIPSWRLDEIKERITTIKQALAAQPAVQEPIGYLFQHEETGLTMVVDVQQVEWGFEKNNPRHQKIGPVYTTPPAAPVQEPVALRPEDVTVEVLMVQSGGGFAPLKTHGVKLTHKPTGIVVQCSSERSQHRNREQALRDLERYLHGARPQPTPPAGQPAPVQEPVAFKQFLSDVHTAAGLVTHGKQCKALGERLSEGVMRYYMATSPAAQPAVPPVVQNICIECANADSWGLPDKPACRSCISNSEWSPLNRSSVNPITPPAAQPAIPDALFRHAPEHPQYIEGWNDCRAEMLKGMKP
jgi:hypothetical protein